MFTLVAFDMARAAAQAALAVVTPVPDQHITIDGNNIVVPAELTKVLGAYVAHGTAAAAGSPTLAQLQSPALRRLFQPDLNRFHDTNTVLNERMVHFFPESVMTLDAGEGLQAWLANGALAAARGLIGVYLADGPVTPVKGEIRTIRFTSVCAPVADAWTLGTLTVIQQLPIGNYQVVGARVISAAECGLFRLIFTGYDWRPGGVITTTILRPDIELQRNGNMGVWGAFDWTHLPRIELLTIAAVANPDVYLDLIKVA